MPSPSIPPIAPFPVQLVRMSFCELQLPQVGCHNVPRSGRLPVNRQIPRNLSRASMTDKLHRGVVEILTPIGPRYLQLTFWQRVYFLWIFRHFSTLPQQVLGRGSVNRIEGLCARQSFVKFAHGAEEAPVIGTVERYQSKVLPGEQLPPRRPAGRIEEVPNISPFAADGSRKS